MYHQLVFPHYYLQFMLYANNYWKGAGSRGDVPQSSNAFGILTLETTKAKKKLKNYVF